MFAGREVRVRVVSVLFASSSNFVWKKHFGNDDQQLNNLEAFLST